MRKAFSLLFLCFSMLIGPALFASSNRAVEEPVLIKGKWTSDEDAALLKGVRLHSKKPWGKI